MVDPFRYSGKNRASISVLWCKEHCVWAKARDKFDNWCVHHCCHLLQQLWWRIRLEIPSSFWGKTEIQGRQIYNWTFKDFQTLLASFHKFLNKHLSDMFNTVLKLNILFIIRDEILCLILCILSAISVFLCNIPINI